MSTSRALPPKRPILDWHRTAPSCATPLPCVADLPYRQMTTSGRAAIYQALRLIAAPAGSTVLVPTYHCPTMVAPVVMLGLKPVFYPIDAFGLPALDRIPEHDAARATCLLAPHYFGLTQSFAAVRDWCDRTNTLLIEDCAHAFYGMAGDRPVGAWGDYATASLTKFFPVIEGGMIASATRPIPSLNLRRPNFKAETKGLFDLIHLSNMHGRLKGFGPFINALSSRGLRSVRPPKALQQRTQQSRTYTEKFALIECDLGRVDQAPLRSTHWIFAKEFKQNTGAYRRKLFEHYFETLSNLPGARPLYASLPPGSVPYAFPLWVDDADRVYRRLRLTGVPVYRWDRIWPGTPEIPEDCGLEWNTHVLQLLCHQNLLPAEIDWSIEMIRQTLNETAPNHAL